MRVELMEMLIATDKELLQEVKAHLCTKDRLIKDLGDQLVRVNGHLARVQGHLFPRCVTRFK